MTRMKIIYLLVAVGISLSFNAACENEDSGKKKSNEINPLEGLSIEWKTDNENYLFFILNADGTAELGQYNADYKNLNSEISDKNATWKTDEITWVEFNMETCDFERKTARGIIVTDSKGFSYKLEVVSAENKTVYLVDNENLAPYNTFANNTDNKFRKR